MPDKWISKKDNGKVRRINLKRDSGLGYSKDMGDVVYVLYKNNNNWIFGRNLLMKGKYKIEKVEGNSLDEVREKAREKWGIVPEIRHKTRHRC